MPWNEAPAWDALARLGPEQVCARAEVTFDQRSGAYTLRSFGQDISVCPKDQSMRSGSPLGGQILDRLGDLSRLPILWYLAGAQDIPLSGDLARPSDLPGGQIYAQGSHVLPLSKIAVRYEHDLTGFTHRAAQLGGKPLKHGDASVELRPFPRVPVSLILWRGDAEFPSSCSLLFDSTCPAHIAPDVAWATAMLSVRLMLGDQT